MRRFHFHVQDGAPWRDEDGVLMADERAARIEAVKYAGALLRDHGATFWEDPVWRLEVADDEDSVLFSLRFSAHDSRETEAECRCGVGLVGGGGERTSES